MDPDYFDQTSKLIERFLEKGYTRSILISERDQFKKKKRWEYLRRIIKMKNKRLYSILSLPTSM